MALYKEHFASQSTTESNKMKRRKYIQNKQITGKKTDEF